MTMFTLCQIRKTTSPVAGICGKIDHRFVTGSGPGRAGPEELSRDNRNSFIAKSIIFFSTFGEARKGYFYTVPMSTGGAPAGALERGAYSARAPVRICRAHSPTQDYSPVSALSHTSSDAAKRQPVGSVQFEPPLWHECRYETSHINSVFHTHSADPKKESILSGELNATHRFFYAAAPLLHRRSEEKGGGAAGG